jgi:hypothetical protein
MNLTTLANELPHRKDKLSRCLTGKELLSRSNSEVTFVHPAEFLSSRQVGKENSLFYLHPAGIRYKYRLLKNTR